MTKLPRTKALAYRLRALREIRGLSQGALAREAGTTQGSVSNYEMGKREVTLATAMDLASALDITLCQLIDLKTDQLIIPAGSRLARAVGALEGSPDLLDRVLERRLRRIASSYDGDKGRARGRGAARRRPARAARRR